MAVEFAYTLYLSAAIAVAEAGEDAGQAERAAIMEVLKPFEDADLLSARGHDLLVLARGHEGDR